MRWSWQLTIYRLISFYCSNNLAPPSSFHWVDPRSHSTNARTLLLLLLARIFANLWRTLSPTSEAWKMRVLLADSPCQFVSPLFNMPLRDLGLLTNAFYVFLYAPFLRVSRFSGSEKRPICWHWSRNVAEPESRALFASFVFVVLPRPS